VFLILVIGNCLFIFTSLLARVDGFKLLRIFGHATGKAFFVGGIKWL
jgi:hypothetical protein